MDVFGIHDGDDFAVLRPEHGGYRLAASNAAGANDAEVHDFCGSLGCVSRRVSSHGLCLRGVDNINERQASVK